MKTTNTAYSNFVKTIWWTIAGMLLAIAFNIYYLAYLGDTTTLGDPYYEDQILAPERAFAPWALSLFGVGLVLVLRVFTWWHKRRA